MNNPAPPCSDGGAFYFYTSPLPAGDAGISFDPLSARGIYSAMQSGKEIYIEACRKKFNRYLQQRHHYYMAERWKDAPFWKRRQEEIIS